MTKDGQNSTKCWTNKFRKLFEHFWIYGAVRTGEKVLTLAAIEEQLNQGFVNTEVESIYVVYRKGADYHRSKTLI